MCWERMKSRVFCHILALPDMIFRGMYFPHDYVEEETYQTIIAASDTGWREVTTLEHMAGEKVYPNAVVAVDRCKRCGKIRKGWKRNV